MQDASHQELVSLALAREPQAVRALVALLSPVVQARVARALAKAGRRQGRDPHQEVADLTQDVFAALFADDGRNLRAWDAARGLSLKGFVGVLAERHCATVLRTARRSPWTEDPTLDAGAELPDSPLEARVESRQLLDKLLERATAVLSPLGRSLFQQLLVEQRPVPDVCARSNLSRDAVYAWQSRLSRLLRTLRAELEAELPGDPS